MPHDVDIESARQIMFFWFTGSDEDNEVLGDGTAEIAHDSTLEIGIEFVDGNEPPS